jgi:hypothetical protein
MTATTGGFSGAVTAPSAAISGNVTAQSLTSNSTIVAAQGFGGAGTIPTAVLGSATIVGSGATIACTASHDCDDFSGSYTLTTGTGISANLAAIFTVHFALTRSNIPNCTYEVVSAGLISDNIILGADTFTINFASSVNLGPSTTYIFTYICGGV